MKPKTHICNVCGKKFPSHAALMQHKSAAHAQAAAGAKSRRRPRQRGSNKQSRGPMGKVVLNGFDSLGNYNIPANMPTGYLIARLPLTPDRLAGSRLRQVTSNWARWRPRKLSINIICGGSAMTFGTIALGWTGDTALAPENRSHASVMQKVLAMRPSIVVRLSSQGRLIVPCETSRKWYMRHGSGEDTTHGQLCLAVCNAVGGYTGSVSVALTMSWEVEVESAELDTATVLDERISPDSGFDHLFTTSDGSWDGNYLTFKNVEGGDMVPWSSARYGVVYGVPSSDTKIPYRQEDKKTYYCRYFTRIQGYRLPGLVLHSTWQNAQDYIKTGVLSYCLPYYGAGDYCTPRRPELVELQQDYPSKRDYHALVAENKMLKERLAAQQTGNLTRVVEKTVQSQLAKMLAELQIRPRGDLLDPLKVITLDPVRGSECDDSSGTSASMLRELGSDPEEWDE